MVYYRSFYSLDHSGDKTRLAWGQARPLMSAGWRERSPGEQEAGMTASSFLCHGHSCSLQTRVVSALALLGCSLSLRSVCFYSPPSPPACRQNPLVSTKLSPSCSSSAVSSSQACSLPSAFVHIPALTSILRALKAHPKLIQSQPCVLLSPHHYVFFLGAAIS